MTSLNKLSNTFMLLQELKQHAPLFPGINLNLLWRLGSRERRAFADIIITNAQSNDDDARYDLVDKELKRNNCTGEGAILSTNSLRHFSLPMTH